MKNKSYKIGFIICLIAFLAVSILMTGKYIIRRNAEKKLEAMKEAVREDSSIPDPPPTTVPTPTTPPTVTPSATPVPSTPTPTPVVDILAARGITIPEKSIDWEELWYENEHIIAWIYIPGTNVDYPIVRHPDEKSYYLSHNYDHSEGYPGCIYVQNVNSADWSDPNTVIYGHNMRDGSMFNTLHYFEDSVFFDEHQYVFIYTPEGNRVYEIFASYPFTDDDLMVCYDYSTPEYRQAYFESIWTNRDMTAHFRDSVKLKEESKIITMSTCIGGEPEMRYLVQALLISPQDS